ncbi:MAG TPA: hypothetical protein PLO61_02215, partial [Fimbriimonadaceae bacterium]|nr:hypothetical protein [Fimbriimonadaceae bacterium]
MTRNFMSRSFAVLAGALALSSAHAVVQDSVTFTNVIVTQTSTATNGTLQTNTFTVTGYSLGRIDYTGDVTEINGTTGDFVSENRCFIVYPGGTPTRDLQFNTTLSYSGTFTYAGSLFFNVGAVAPFGGAWNFYFRNTVDDTPSGQPDSQINVTFNLTDEPPVPPTTTADFNPLPDGLSQDSQTYTAGQVRWYKVVLPNAINLTRYLDIDTEDSTTATAATAIAMYDNSGTLIISDTADGSGLLSQLTFGGSVNPRGTYVTGTNSVSLNRNGRDGSLAAGTYYVGVSRTTTTWGAPWTATSTSTGTATLNLRLNTGTVSGQPPATDLGTLTSDSLGNPVNITSSANVVWYKFNIPVATDLNNYLDIDTDNGIPILDTEVGLFDATGTLIAEDDDDGRGLYSTVSFGGQNNPRSPILDAVNGNQFPADGRDGNLPAGTYYVAVARFSATFANGFFVTGSTSAGTAALNIRIGSVSGTAVAPTATDLGTVTPAGLTGTLTHAVGETQWYKFTLTAPTDDVDKYVDIDTEEGTATLNTVIGLYRADGTRVGADDEDGSGSLSQLSFDGDANPRAAFVTGANAPSVAYDGRDGALTPGVYYIAVAQSGFAANWYNGPTGFAFGTASTQVSADVRVNVRSNLGGGGSDTVTGTVDFGQLTAAYNTGANLPTSIPVSFRDAGNSEIATGSATYDPVTGA